MKLRIGNQTLDVRPGAPGGPATLVVDGTALPLTVESRVRRGESWELRVRLGDRPARWWVTPLPDGTWAVASPGGAMAIAAPGGADAAPTGPHGPLKSPMAGVVTALHVQPGEAVAAGAPLAVVEAMKMRFTVSAEADALVGAVEVALGALVTANQVLMHLAPPEAPAEAASDAAG